MAGVAYRIASTLIPLTANHARSADPSEARELHLAAFVGVELLPVNQSGGAWDHSAGLSYYDAESIDAAVVCAGQLVSADEKQLKQAAAAGIKVMSFSPGAERDV